MVGATTGASIWLVGGIGMACGFGFYVHAVLITAIAAVILVGLYYLGRRIGDRDLEGERE